MQSTVGFTSTTKVLDMDVTERETRSDGEDIDKLVDFLFRAYERLHRTRFDRLL